MRVRKLKIISVLFLASVLLYLVSVFKLISNKTGYKSVANIVTDMINWYFSDISSNWEDTKHNSVKTVTNKITFFHKINPKLRHYFDSSGMEMNMTVNPGINKSICAIQTNDIVQSNFEQILNIYERTNFHDIQRNVSDDVQDIQYNESYWTKERKLKVFIIPHSHNDAGWMKTFDLYYSRQTKAIFKNMVKKLSEKLTRKFIWAEICYLSFWWDSEATDKEKATIKTLLKTGQLEIVTGGWVINDEANTHWLSIMEQLTVGHQWLVEALDYIPKNSWNIDPFGHSNSQPYILKLAGLQNSVINRVHYKIKAELASKKMLEFKWRQIWDNIGKTDLLTHVLPFESYDIPYSCGPDPKICCQFDFKRLPGSNLLCRWGIRLHPILNENIAERVMTILDQWRKKSQLYHSNIVMFPLGDDFRYDTTNEWDQQFINYEKLITYINSNESFNTEVQFGTLQDYFKALRSELNTRDFPVVSGDFFTYANHKQHYWSGYYTSRPFHKHMDRVLMRYLHAAENIVAKIIIHLNRNTSMMVQWKDNLETARRALALFQHHDGISGTSVAIVANDFAQKLITGIKNCQKVIGEATYHLLRRRHARHQRKEFDIDDVWYTIKELPSRIPIVLNATSQSKRIVFYNSLTYRRQEIVSVIVCTPFVEVLDSNGRPTPSQISPLVTVDSALMFHENRHQVHFLATVEPLTHAIYSVSLRSQDDNKTQSVYSKVRVFNVHEWSISIPKIFEPNHFNAPDKGIVMKVGNRTRVLIGVDGLLQAVASTEKYIFPVKTELISYSTDRGKDKNSGAYMFLPDGPPTKLEGEDFPEIIIIEGPIISSAYTIFKDRQSIAENSVVTSIYNNPSLPHTEVEVSNTIKMETKKYDIEIALKFSTDIENNNIFYTDSNGMQMIKRMHFSKFPIQANYYPLPAAAYIEDNTHRMTVLTSTPLGVAAQQSGEIEIMQDRRLIYDDNRILKQGLMDNVRTRHTFRLVFEKVMGDCKISNPTYTGGFLSVGGHISSQSLLHPLIIMHYSSKKDVPINPRFAMGTPLSVDLVLASYRSHITGKMINGTKINGLGMTFQRVKLDTCFANQNVTKFYPIGDGRIDMSTFKGIDSNTIIYDCSLTYTQIGDRIHDRVLSICPMEITSIFINYPHY